MVVSSAGIGIGNNAPSCALDVIGNTSFVGGCSYNVTAVSTSTYTIKLSDYYIAVSSSSGGVTLTLPTTIGNTNQIYSFSKISTDYNIVTINTTGSDLIGGQSSLTLQIPFSCVTLICPSNGIWNIAQFNNGLPSPDTYGLFPSAAGTDGSVVYSANTTLVRNMHFVNLTVNTGITLNAAGWRILVVGTLTLNGVISNGGGSASGITAGAAPTVGTTYLGCGSSGGAGRTNNGSGTAGVAATYATFGGLGGTGGGGGVGGTVVAVTAVTGGTQVISNMPNAWMGRINPGTAVASWFQGGTGGGSGICNRGSATTIASGAGGAGGGVIVIAARNVVGSGSITAVGGNGSNATYTGAGTPGSTGGGGGGGGGVIVFLYQVQQNTVTLSVAGGTGGTAVGSGGITGASGSVGLIYQIHV
jgi:hypothetical protein